MNAMTRRVMLQISAASGASLLLSPFCQADEPTSPVRDPNAVDGSLAAILNDKSIWGTGFPEVLSGMPRWKEGEIRSMILFPDRIVSSTTYKDEANAKKALDALAKVTVSKKLAVRKAFKEIKGIQPDVTSLKPKVLKSFADDRSIRLEWTDKAAKFFVSDLKMTTVREHHGAPQRVWAEAISTGGGWDRPLGLTSYYYADGAIAFVKSDLDLDPDHVDRIVLNCSLIVPALLEETPG